MFAPKSNAVVYLISKNDPLFYIPKHTVRKKTNQISIVIKVVKLYNFSYGQNANLNISHKFSYLGGFV